MKADFDEAKVLGWITFVMGAILISVAAGAFIVSN